MLFRAASFEAWKYYSSKSVEVWLLDPNLWLGSYLDKH